MASFDKFKASPLFCLGLRCASPGMQLPMLATSALSVWVWPDGSVVAREPGRSDSSPVMFCFP